MSKIVVGISGGVDSAVSAYLLKQKGHQVIGVFMRNWDSALNNDVLGNPNAKASACPEELDYQDAIKLCKQIGIELKRVDFVQEYYQEVFQDLIDQYKKGRTPNPDILCNRYIKFGSFFDWIEKNIKNVDYIATGHYAKVENGLLYKCLDESKDQTYFLAQVKKEKFQKVLFPLANLTKKEVRQIAKEQNLIVANKKDSTGICFIGERQFTKFLQNYIPSQPGNIIDIKTNKIIGKHVGVMYYTIGQRHGLNLGGMKNPYYVAGQDLKRKIIYACSQEDMDFLMSDQAEIVNLNWIFENFKNENIEVKFRYKSQAVKCSLAFLKNKLIVKYPQGFKSVTPGQQAVFYQGNKCLGGGVINKVFYQGKIKEYV